jgi:hypothetical protein
MITKAYSKYFQKSKAFLFPLLGLPKFALTFEIETYLVLDNIVSLEDVNIVCKIKHNDSEDFFIYEKKYIDKSRYLVDKFENKELKETIYIFSLEDYREDYTNFLNGKYSKFSKDSKSIIKKYYTLYKNELDHFNSYLNPSDFLNLYTNLLNVDMDVLKEVGELCDKYDLNKETLKNSEINFEISL